MSERSERLALNLEHLDRLPSEIRSNLLTGRVDLKIVKIHVDRVNPEAAVLLTCNLLEAAKVCDVVRSYDRKVGEFPTQVYILKKNWSRVPSSLHMTVVSGENVILNPELFPEKKDVEPIDPIPMTPKRMF